MTHANTRCSTSCIVLNCSFIRVHTHTHSRVYVYVSFVVQQSVHSTFNTDLMLLRRLSQTGFMDSAERLPPSVLTTKYQSQIVTGYNPMAQRLRGFPHSTRVSDYGSTVLPWVNCDASWIGLATLPQRLAFGVTINEELKKYTLLYTMSKYIY